MDSDRVNRWLTLGANLGVLVGIILLVVELDQNRDMMRSQIRYRVFQDEANYNLSVATDRELVEVIYRAGQGEALTGPDGLQNFLRLVAYFRIQQNIHYQFQQGLIDEDEYQSIRQARQGFVGVSLETARTWCVLRRGTTTQFREDMEQSFVNLNCDELENSIRLD